MNTWCHRRFAAIAAGCALCAAAPASADEAEDLQRQTKPESEAVAGVGYATGASRQFGQYSGINERGFYGLLDLSLIRRDEPTGTWLSLQGRNLGLDSRELRFDHNRQGVWGYAVEFTQTPRYDPHVINTRLSGIESGSQTINGNATAQDVELKTRRDMIRLGAERYLPGGFDVLDRLPQRGEDRLATVRPGLLRPDQLPDQSDRLPDAAARCRHQLHR
jgi:hypothetical protein